MVSDTGECAQPGITDADDLLDVREEIRKYQRCCYRAIAVFA
jgi:hypothetical protein